MIAVGFNYDHFIYRFDRPTRGRDGRCTRCGVAFVTDDLVRISGDLNEYGRWWHENCAPASHSLETT